MKETRRVPKWFICAVVVVAPFFFTQKAISQANVVIELSKDSEPTLVVAPKQMITWATGPESGSNAVRGIVFSGKDPCAQAPDQSGSCQIKDHATGSYTYNFCQDMLTSGDDNKCLSQPGVLKIYQAGSDSQPSGSPQLVLYPYGGIHNLLKPKDKVFWFDENGKSVSIRITSRKPKKIGPICEEENVAGVGGMIRSCTVMDAADGVDFEYKCDDDVCKDPTAHVRSVGLGGPFAVLLREVRIKVWLTLILAGMSFGFLGFAAHRMWRRLFFAK